MYLMELQKKKKVITVYLKDSYFLKKGVQFMSNHLVTHNFHLGL